MSFSDLVSLESQLNDSLLSVKDQKVKTDYFFNSKRLKESSLTCTVFFRQSCSTRLKDLGYR